MIIHIYMCSPHEIQSSVFKINARILQLFEVCHFECMHVLKTGADSYWKIPGKEVQDSENFYQVCLSLRTEEWHTVSHRCKTSQKHVRGVSK